MLISVGARTTALCNGAPRGCVTKKLAHSCLNAATVVHPGGAGAHSNRTLRAHLTRTINTHTYLHTHKTHTRTHSTHARATTSKAWPERDDGTMVLSVDESNTLGVAVSADNFGNFHFMTTQSCTKNPHHPHHRHHRSSHHPRRSCACVQRPCVTTSRGHR